VTRPFLRRPNRRKRLVPSGRIKKNVVRGAVHAAHLRVINGVWGTSKKRIKETNTKIMPWRQEENNVSALAHLYVCGCVGMQGTSSLPPPYVAGAQFWKERERCFLRSIESIAMGPHACVSWRAKGHDSRGKSLGEGKARECSIRRMRDVSGS
jgi:hypothetical protein